MEDVKEDESVECIGEALNPTENLIGEKAEPASINFILHVCLCRHGIYLPRYLPYTHMGQDGERNFRCFTACGIFSGLDVGCKKVCVAGGFK